MLSNSSRQLTFLTAGLYGILGLILMVAPAQMAPVFPWKVTPFMTMTIGAWCVGNAWLAWTSARRWEWGLVRTSLFYLWLFGLLQSAVLFEFREKLQLGSPLAWLYLAAIGLNLLTALWGITDWVRRRPAARLGGPPPGPALRVATLAFIAFVGFIAIYGLRVTLGGRGTSGTIFPEIMSLFTLRSFAVFYLALALSAVPLLWADSRDTLLHHIYGSYGLLVTITFATFVYIDRFDFVAKPKGLIYLGAYLGVGAATGYVMLKYGTGRRDSNAAAADARAPVVP